jgi:glycosyltransferase involved in cell wall biosynthesis
LGPPVTGKLPNDPLAGGSTGRKASCRRYLIALAHVPRRGCHSGGVSEKVRILAVAYASSPDAGSEPGAGWIWSRMLATFGETWVLTRTRPSEELARRQAAMRELGIEDRLHFVDVDLPQWTRVWRVDRPGRTRLQRLHYVVWHFVAFRRARMLQRSVGFDLGWHLTFANTLGSLIAFLGIPFVLGPIGGAVQPPWRLVGELGLRGIVFEALRTAAQRVVRYANPWGSRTWARASLILVQNPETREWLPAEVRDRTVVFPNAVVESFAEPDGRLEHNPPRALFAGVLSPWKGASLAVRALALLPNWRLLICGEGPDAKRLESLVRRLRVADRVTFLGWQPRKEVLRLMRDEADVFLFPSLHDEGPWVIVEARAAGLPVVCLDRGGPPVLGGHGVAATSRRATVQALARAITEVRGRSAAPPTDFAFEAKRSALAEILAQFRLLGADRT